MFNPNAFNKINYPTGKNSNQVTKAEHISSNSDTPAAYEETEALLMLLETSVVELNQPASTVLGLSEQLLAQAKPETSLANNLAVIVREMRRVNEVVRGLQLLTDYSTDTATH